MKYCPKCRIEYPQLTRFCSNCGSLLIELAEEIEEDPAPEESAPELREEEAETAALPGEAQEVGEVLSTEEIIARVVEMQGQPVEELIDWLGEPASRDYASSCNIEGGQDGQLDYGDFTVFTIVWPDGSETVDFCEAN